MNDWVGLAFIIGLLIVALLGLRTLAKPATRTAEDFERSAAEGTTMLGATMNALQEMMNPEEAKAKETIMQMKEGRYQKKRKEGKAGGDIDND
jgi:hypothetical protein